MTGEQRNGGKITRSKKQVRIVTNKRDKTKPSASDLIFSVE